MTNTEDDIIECRGCDAPIDRESAIRGMCEGCADDENEFDRTECIWEG